MIRIGVDTGGTFTDLVVLDDETGRTTVAKVPSTPAAPASASGVTTEPSAASRSRTPTQSGRATNGSGLARRRS